MDPVIFKNVTTAWSSTSKDERMFDSLVIRPHSEENEISVENR